MNAQIHISVLDKFEPGWRTNLTSLVWDSVLNKFKYVLNVYARGFVLNTIFSKHTYRILCFDKNDKLKLLYSVSLGLYFCWVVIMRVFAVSYTTTFHFKNVFLYNLKCYYCIYLSFPFLFFFFLTAFSHHFVLLRQMIVWRPGDIPRITDILTSS